MTAASQAPRFRKIDTGSSYSNTAYEVLVDGVVVGRVERTAHSNYPGKKKYAAIVVWYAYDPAGRQVARRYTRGEAVADLLAELG